MKIDIVQERQHDDGRDSYDKICCDMLILVNKIRDFKLRTRKTPLYRVIDHLRLYKEFKNLKRQSYSIDERLKRIEEDHIQIVRRI